MAKGVIFDFDGVLAETEPFQLAAYNRLLAEYGVPPICRISFEQQYIGLPTPRIIESLQNEFKLSRSVAELTAFKEVIYRGIVHQAALEPEPALIALLDELQSRGWKLAIASSSSSVTLQELLASLRLRRYFEHVVSSDHVSKGKPAPDIYDLAVTRLGIEKGRIVVVEDSRPGLVSAKQAGLKCVVIPSRFTNGQDFSESDLLVGHLSELTHQKMLSLIRPEIVYIPKSESGYCHALEGSLCNLSSNRRATLIVRKPRKDEDPNSQYAELKDLSRHAPGALILVPADDGDRMRGLLASLMLEGTTVATVDQDVAVKIQQGDGRTRRSFNVVANCQRGGELAAEVIVRTIGKRGAVGIVSGPENAKPAKDRRLGFLGYIANHAPQVHLEALEYTSWSKEEGARAANTFIRNGLDLDGIFCGCDNLAIGVLNSYLEAREASQALKMPAIVGFDGIPEIYEHILAERIVATIDVKVGAQAHEAFSAVTTGAVLDTTVVEPRVLTAATIKRDRGRTQCFISYHHGDSAMAGHLDRSLSQEGFKTFLDTSRVAIGERFVSHLREEISKSQVMLVLLSEGSVQSRYVQDELKFAADSEDRAKLRILPLRLKGNYEVPLMIQAHSPLDLTTESVPLSADKLLRLIRSIDNERQLVG